MLSRRDFISSPAHDAIADGDDLLMTPSFDPEEENSSVIGNASCRTRSIVVGMSEKENNMTGKKSMVDETSLQLSKGSLKVKKLLKRVQKLPRTLRQNSFLFRSSSNTVGEYEEMLENGFGLEEEENFDHDEETIASLRSCRNNVRTGMSMLVRQKALVMNRPSSAFCRETLKAPSPDPKNFRNAMLLRGKSLILDDCSIGGMSDITEDASTIYAYPNTDHLSFRRTPMFINAKTYRINEDEDESESESDNDETNSETPPHNAPLDRGYDFRELSPLNDGIEEASCESDETETRSNAHYLMRRRIYSDSDIVTSDANISNLSSLTTSMSPRNKESVFSEDHKCSESPILKKLQSKGVDRTTVATPVRKAVPFVSWPFPRTRNYSDSYVSPTKQDEANKVMQKQTIQHRNRSASHEYLISDAILTTRQYSRRQSLPLFQSNVQSSSSDSRTRTYSDSVVNDKSTNEDILWDPRNACLLDTEPIGTNQDFNISSKQTGLIGKEIKTLLPETPCPATSSVLATLSNTKTHTPVETKKQQRPSPSPRTLIAASQIAAALRPAPTKALPALPSPRQTVEEYYWGENSDAANDTIDKEQELHNLCSWSSDSFDDIL